MAGKPFRDTNDGLVVFVRLTPNSQSDKITGGVTTGDGVCRLGVRVRAIPDKHKANKALIKLLAKQFKVRQADISLIAGQKSRNKTVLVNCEKNNLKTTIIAMMVE